MLIFCIFKQVIVIPHFSCCSVIWTLNEDFSEDYFWAIVHFCKLRNIELLDQPNLWVFSANTPGHFFNLQILSHRKKSSENKCRADDIYLIFSNLVFSSFTFCISFSLLSMRLSDMVNKGIEIFCKAPMIKWLLLYQNILVG